MRNAFLTMGGVYSFSILIDKMITFFAAEFWILVGFAHVGTPLGLTIYYIKGGQLRYKSKSILNGGKFGDAVEESDQEVVMFSEWGIAGEGGDDDFEGVSFPVWSLEECEVVWQVVFQ